MKVRVYSTPSCHWCAVAKEFLEKNKIKFEDIDVSEDQELANEMIAKSGQMGVPVIIVSEERREEVIIGFDEAALRKTLKIK